MLGTVFGLEARERGLTILVDLPNSLLPDTSAWRDRRRIAAEWFTMLHAHFGSLPFAAITCCTYPNVGSNNGDLPPVVTLVDSVTKEHVTRNVAEMPLGDLLQGSSVVLAVTELSATAPLKVLARQHGFRGATLPGFTRSMVPSLLLDYEKVNRRVMELKERLDRASQARILLRGGNRKYESIFDLRFRSGHASGGIIREAGTVGNLPSGEAYIVPYEGERPDEKSGTAGLLPVEFGDEVVVFRLANNRCVAVETDGEQSTIQRQRIAAEPAYGNIAELGIGVLGEWGVEAVGSTLLDEKLGLHIAFGRSEHFGGATGPGAFRDPRNVIHIDWVYVPSVQPKIAVESVVLNYPGGPDEMVIREGKLGI